MFLFINFDSSNGVTTSSLPQIISVGIEMSFNTEHVSERSASAINPCVIMC